VAAKYPITPHVSAAPSRVKDRLLSEKPVDSAT
jgi:hypothetical protein